MRLLTLIRQVRRSVTDAASPNQIRLVKPDPYS